MKKKFDRRTYLRQTTMDLERIKKSNQQVLEKVYKKNVPNAANTKSFSELLGTESRYKKKSENEEKKKYLSELLLNFNQIEQDNHFDELLTELYKLKKDCKLNKIPMNINPGQSNSKYLLLYILEKILFEISYVRNKEIRTQMINKVYYWFKHIQKTDEETRRMILKTYKTPGEFDEEELLLLNSDKKKEEMNEEYLEMLSHRNADLVNKRMLNEYERKKISDRFLKLPIIDSSRYSISKNTLISSPSCPDFQKTDLSTLYSSEKGNNSYTLKKNYLIAVENFVEKVEGGEKEKNYLKNYLSENDEFISQLGKETKYSYSFFRPDYKFENLVIENKIIESKQKLLAQKRHEEELKIKMKEFGILRAKYRENINNRYEMKNMLNMYVNYNRFQSPILKKYENKDIKIQELENEEENTNQNVLSFTRLSKKLSSPRVLFSTPRMKNFASSKQVKTFEIINNMNDNKGIIKNIDNNDDINSPKSKRSFEKKTTFSFTPKSFFLEDKEKNIENNKENKGNKERKESIESKENIENKENKENKDKFGIIPDYIISKRSIRRHSKSFKNKKEDDNFCHSSPKKKISHEVIVDEEKVKINEIKNLDIKSKDIKGLKDKKTKEINIKLKLPDEISEININRNLKNIQPDTVSYLYFNNSLFKEKMYNDAICNIKNYNSVRKKSSSTSLNDLNVNNNLNFRLSAFSPDNLRKINRCNILNNIIAKKLENNEKNNNSNSKTNLKNLNKNFNEYKNNYLKLRRILSNCKKKEYDSLINKLRNHKEIKDDDSEFDDDVEELQYIKSSSPINDINNKKNQNNSLIEAMLNPSENISCSKYFLPRSGSMLLSRKTDV